MAQGFACQYIATSGASLTVLTGQGYLYSIYAYASGAAATITIFDSASTVLSWSGATAAVLTFTPLKPLALIKGLTVTNSGAGTYTICYGTGP